MKFDLAKFRDKMISFVNGEEGEEFTPSMVLSELIKSDDVRTLFKGKGIDADKVEKLVKLERQQIIEKKQRKSKNEEEHKEDAAAEDLFEMSKHGSRRQKTIHSTARNRWSFWSTACACAHSPTTKPTSPPPTC